jgi:hypothetical protein
MKATMFIVTMLLCAASSASAAPVVKDADADAVAKCTFLQDVQGRNALGERLKEQAVKNAKEEARAKAAKAGATHIVWGNVSSTDITTIDAKAYRCDG